MNTFAEIPQVNATVDPDGDAWRVTCWEYDKPDRKKIYSYAMSGRDEGMAAMAGIRRFVEEWQNERG